MIRAAFLFILLADGLMAGCVAVEGDQILARHLVKVDEAFDQLSSGTYLSYAPKIGERRVVTAKEIQHWAFEHNISARVRESVCFEGAGRSSQAEDFEREIRRILGREDVEISVLDYSHESLPPGHVQMNRAGAALPSPNHSDWPFLWHGEWVADSGSRYAVWARVRILAPVRVIRSKSALPSGTLIRRESIEETQVRGCPLMQESAETVDLYVGKQLVHAVGKGELLNLAMVQSPPAVLKGNSVRVEVRSGFASLRFSARAENSGAIGDTIVLTNPSGSRKFKAVVAAPGRVLINLTEPVTATADQAQEQPARALTAKLGAQ
jgi:flagella basal body P-ring formation protein FlgA